MWLVVLGFMVIGLVSGFSLANLVTQGPSWCGARITQPKTDSSEKDSGRLVGHVASPLTFQGVLPVGGRLLVPPCPYHVPPQVVK